MKLWQQEQEKTFENKESENVVLIQFRNFVSFNIVHVASGGNLFFREEKKFLG